MKRFLSGVLAALMLCGVLTGCSGKPSGMTDNVYDYGCKALDVVDQYLDTELTAEEAQSKLEQIGAMIDPQSDDTVMKNTEEMIKSETEFLVFLMIGAQNKMENLESTISDIREWRDKLAKDLGK